MDALQSPLRELWQHYRRHQQVPTEWLRQFSPSGNLDEASRNAWATDTDPLTMAMLACRFADRRAQAVAAADIARLLLPHLTKKRALHEKALDFLETWGTKPETPEPRMGWEALADSVAPEDDKEDVATFAAESISSALTIPLYPVALRSLVQGVVDRTAQSIVKTEERGRRRTEAEIDEIDGRAQDLMYPILAGRLRAHIPAPDGAALMDALQVDREKALEQAMARNNKRELATFRPE